MKFFERIIGVEPLDNSAKNQRDHEADDKWINDAVSKFMKNNEFVEKFIDQIKEDN